MGIAAVAWVPVTGAWGRHTAPGISGTDAHAGPSRWLSASARGLYLADSADTAWAELYRALAESGRSPVSVMPRDLHSILVKLERVADLSREESRRALGLPRIRPNQSQWPAFQAVAEDLISDGAQGVLYRSAARARSLCLCVFEPGLGGLSTNTQPVRVLTPPVPPRGMRT